MLWRVKPKDEISLDRYEGYPRFYEKDTIELELNGKAVSAFVYVMTEGHQLGMPSESYRKTIEEGYKTAGFDTSILEDAIADTEKRMAIEQENSPEQDNLLGMVWW